jgi:minor extracellular serine protease Vpr
MRKPTSPWLLWLIPLCMTPLCVQCEAPPATSSTPAAMTNRLPPHHDTMVFHLLQLKTKALLDGVQLDRKRIPLIDAKRKADILVEQEEAIATLRGLSSDVQIIYRYRFVLNGLAVVMPRTLVNSDSLPGVIRMQASQPMQLPQTTSKGGNSPTDFSTTSVSFIGAQEVWQKLGITGKGIRVGVIDTGIDYTHRMFGGSGNVADYKNIDPDTDPDPRQFPTSKVRGGIDLVGSTYNSDSDTFLDHIPHPKKNPLDESGHGTHVAGTIAGIGDGIHTYTGVAPDAELFAIKVFGKKGSTEDSVIIAGLEYAVDPDGDLDPRDRLDVVNLSLGSSFGLPYILYDEAIRNFTQAGITAIMSAGNSGNVPYIVGSPGSSSEAISVAASTDDMAHNWKFPAVRFRYADGEEILLERAREFSTTKPISEAKDVSGRLISIGQAKEPIPMELAEKQAGNVALIDRGEVNFDIKLKHAQNAGAIGVVMVNNRPGETDYIGGEGTFPIPGIMVSQETGEKLKAAMRNGKEVWIDFSTSLQIKEPTLINTLTSFSSRGPRAMDSLIKPEITAPGQAIVSAKMGGGAAGTKKNGTSMAAPHMTGVVALLKQAHPDYTEQDVRAALLGTSLLLQDKGSPYSVAYQGTGRVQIFQALTTPLLVSPATWSLGEIAGKHRQTKTFRLRNTQSQPLSMVVEMKRSDDSVQIEGPTEIVLAAEETREVEFCAVSTGEKIGEHSAWIEFRTADSEESVAHISILAVTKKLSDMNADTVETTRKGDANVRVENRGNSNGEMLLFQYLGGNPREAGIGPGGEIADICDLQSAGYRLIKNEEGNDILQVAVKLYRPLSSWEQCEISVQISSSKEMKADWELLGTDLRSLMPKSPYGSFYSVFTSAKEMHEQRILSQDSDEEDTDYTKAIIALHPFLHYDFGTLGIVEVDIKKAMLPPQVWMKVAALTLQSSIKTSDYFLGGKAASWLGVSLDPAQQAYSNFPLKTVVPHHGSSIASLHRGTGKGTLVAYFPYNKDEFVVGKRDLQQKRLKEVAL